MDEKRFHQIIRGDYSNLPKDKSKIVRIFLSSTFSDTHTERDFLIANVYPKLKTYCKTEYNIDFQILDMRWGISNELTNGHLATSICLDEVKKSQKYSLGPNFITLLSHRYGRICLPTRIVANEFELIRSEIKEFANEFDLSFSYKYGESLVQLENILDYCYELDENAEPSRYRLKFLNKIFPNLNHKETEFDKLWNKLEQKLGDILRKAAKVCYENKLINKTQYERYFVSVTEKEIFNGILNAKNLANNVLFFEREIVDIEQNIQNNRKLAAKFIDLDDKFNVDENAKHFLNDLKYNKIPSRLPSSNIFKLKVKWSNEGISLETHSEYVKEFGNLFFEQVKKLIDLNHSKNDEFLEKLNKRDLMLFQEVLYHANFCNQTVEKFHGREDVLKNLQNYVLSDNETPFIIHGDSGCGKTAILAKATSQILKYVPDPINYSVILRFLGTTPSTSNIIITYVSILRQISRIFNFKMPPISLENKEQLKEHLIEQFILINKFFPNRKLIIILDSIDQLNSSDYDLEWLIESFPSNVKMIYSTLPKHGLILDRLKSKKFEKTNYIEITALNMDLATRILRDWLARIHRSLSQTQWHVIETMWTNRPHLYPLYVKIVFDIVTKWQSFYEPDENFKKCIDIDSTIRYLFSLLEVEHGKLLFSRAVIYMTSFKDGISESEIEDILSLDDEVLYDIFEFHSPPVRKLPSALWTRIKHDLQAYMVEKEVDDTRVVCWYHRRFIEVTNSHYISKTSTANKEEIFSNVIDFFNETWKNKPKPFKYNKYVASKKKLKDENAEEIRETSIQQTVIIGKDQIIHYNKRKLKELPNFIGQLNSNLAFQMSCQFVYLNYHFLNGLFLYCTTNEIMADLGTISQRSNYNLTTDAQGALNELMIFNIIILQSMVSIKMYPESAGLEFVARSLILYGRSKYFTQFIDQYDTESSLNCALIVPYQLTQVVGSDTIFQLEKHNKPIKCVVLGGYQIGVVFSLSDKLNVMDFNSSKTFETDFSLENTEKEFNYMIVYITGEIPLDKTLKDFKGGFLVASENEIISYSFEIEIFFKKKFHSQSIINICLISSNHLLVAFAESLDIYNLFTGELISRKYFRDKIKFLLSNSDPKIIIDLNTFNSSYDDHHIISYKHCLIAIVFESAELNLFHAYFESNNTNNSIDLKLVFEMPSSGFNCNSLYYDSKNPDQFILTLNYGMLVFLSFSVDLLIKNTQNKKAVEVNFAKIKLEDKIEMIVKNGDPNDLLLLGSDGCLYLLVEKTKFTAKIKGKGEYSNAMIPSKNRLLAFTQTTVEFFYYEISGENKQLKIALIRKMNIHYDDVTFCSIRSNLLYTASKDSTLKLSIYETTNLNIKYIDFDRNEKEIEKLIIIDSIHVLALMKNSNKLNLWNLSNGKIVYKIETPATHIVEDCLLLSETWLLIFSNRLTNNLSSQFCFIKGYHISLENDQNKFTLKFNIKINRGEIFRHFSLKNNELIVMTKDRSIHLYKLNAEKLSYSKPEKIAVLIEPSYDLVNVSSLDYFDSSLIKNNKICVTNKNNVIVLFIHSSLLFIDSVSNCVLLQSDIEEKKNNSLQFFLSPTNLTLNRLFNLTAVDSSDNIVALGNLNNLVFISYDFKLNRIRMFKSNEEKNSFQSFVLGKTGFLLGCDQLHGELIGYDLNDKKPFERIHFKVSFSHDLIQTYNISSDCKYVYLIEKRSTLKFYRVSDSKRIAGTQLYCMAKKTTCSDEYICLGMQDKRVISFLIVDPLILNSSAKIKQLESRSKTQHHMLSEPSKYFEVDSRVIQYSEIFRPTLIGDPATDPVFAKIINIFKEIQKTIQEMPLNENFLLSDQINDINLTNDWLKTLLKQNSMLDDNGQIILKSKNKNSNDETMNKKKLDEFKKDLVESLIAPRVELRTKNFGNISIIRNDLRNTSSACNIQ